jgi:hypothetical protein
MDVPARGGGGGVATGGVILHHTTFPQEPEVPKSTDGYEGYPKYSGLTL